MIYFDTYKKVTDEIMVLQGLCERSCNDRDIEDGVFDHWRTELLAYCRALRDAGIISTEERDELVFGKKEDEHETQES